MNGHCLQRLYRQQITNQQRPLSAETLPSTENKTAMSIVCRVTLASAMNKLSTGKGFKSPPILQRSFRLWQRNVRCRFDPLIITPPSRILAPATGERTYLYGDSWRWTDNQPTHIVWAVTVLISTATLSPQRRCLTRLSVRVHRAIAHAYHDSVSSKCLSMLVTTLCHRSKCQRRHLSPLSVSADTYHHSLSASILITTLCHRSKCLRRHLSPLCQRRYLSPLSVSVHTYHHSLSASILITTLCHRSKCLRRHLSPFCQRRYLSPLSVSVPNVCRLSGSVQRVSVDAYHGTLSAFIGSVSMLITALCQRS